MPPHEGSAGGGAALVPGWVLAASSSSWALRRISCCRPASETPTCEDRGVGQGLGMAGQGAHGAAQSRQNHLLPDFWHLRLDMWRLTGWQSVRWKEREIGAGDRMGPASAGAEPTAVGSHSS